MMCEVAEVKNSKIIIIYLPFSLVSRNEDSEVALPVSMVLPFICVC